MSSNQMAQAENAAPTMAALNDHNVFDRMYRMAELMANAKLIPEHLQKSTGDCFMVVQQAYRWQMDPFAVAQKTFVVSGKLGYEGQLVAAVVNSRAPIVGRLNYEHHGQGDDRGVTVSGTLEGESKARTLTIRLGDVKTGNKNWQQIGDQMLAYRGARDWARRHTPEVILGVYTHDELEDMRSGDRREARDVTPPPSELPRGELPAYPQQSLDQNLDKWRAAIEAGKTTAEAIIQKVETKGTLSDDQKRVIRNLEAIDAQEATDADS